MSIPNSFASQKSQILQSDFRKSQVQKTFARNRLLYRLQQESESFQINPEILTQNEILNLIFKDEFKKIDSLISNDQLTSVFCVCINSDNNLLDKLSRTNFLEYCLEIVEIISNKSIYSYKDKPMYDWYLICLNFVLNIIIYEKIEKKAIIWQKIVDICTDILINKKDFQANYIILQILSNYVKHLSDLEINSGLKIFQENNFEKIHQNILENIHDLSLPFESLCYFYKNMFACLKLKRNYDKVT